MDFNAIILIFGMNLYYNGIWLGFKNRIIFKMMEPKRKINLRYGIRQMSFCSNQSIFLLIVNNSIQIYDSDLQMPIHTIKDQNNPRSAQLSKSGKYFFIHNSNNEIYLYDTKTATKIQKIIGAPFSTKIVRFSANSEKIIYGNTQLLCMWDIVKCRITMRTENWKNINCYDLNEKGDQFAIGTYNGSIFVVSFVSEGRCSQIEMKRHKSCVMAICYHKQKLISNSYDGHLLISKISSSTSGEKLISYQDKYLEQIPRMIESCGDSYYMFDPKGMFWYNPLGRLIGFTDGKSYRVIQNEDGELIYIKYDKASIEWWPSSLFQAKKVILTQVTSEN